VRIRRIHGKEKRDMSYLERYLQGEHEQVWDELIGLGAAVFQEPLYEEAVAVVQEVMRRVRLNIEQLVPRLANSGFVFGYDYRLQWTLRRSRAGVNWPEYLREMRRVREQSPVFLPPSIRDESRTEAQIPGLESPDDDLLDDSSSTDMRAHIRELDRIAGPLPLSLRGWYEWVGAVNLFGYHPGWVSYVALSHHLMAYCDPLQVCALDDARMAELLFSHRLQRLAWFEFAVDPYVKNFTSGSSTPYAIDIRGAGIDGVVVGFPPMTFVQYLRKCFRWAGFPGMAEWPTTPTEDLAHLTQGLLPF
jgi:hypothetical protein